MTKVSPFKYGSTVSGDSFTGRKEEIAKLTHNILSGIHTTVISPRRWGKSSLVEKTVDDIIKSHKDIKAVFIDLFSISSEQEFLEVYTREVIKATSTKLQDRLNAIKSFFKQISPKVSLGTDLNTEFSIGFDWNEAKKHKSEILNLPEVIATEKNIRLIICLDEFQNIGNYQQEEELEKAMRACWQRHDHVSYCLYGSKRHMMEELFSRSSKPFYRFGDIMFLEKIPQNEWTAFIKKGFQDTGKKIARQYAETIPKIMENHSWYVQQLSAYIWRLTDKEVNNDVLARGLIEVINTNMPLFQNEIENLSVKQVNLLKAIADGEVQLTSTRVMQKYDIGTPVNITKNRDKLEKEDLIYRINGKKYEFLDPVFKIWFMIQYYNKNFNSFIENKKDN
ncbi:MAG: ATP-binding protein [Candidatus Neomarinimicrobiota bacterium]|jgi:hypothetical protein|nr:ATP-binding protein [bacterium]